MVWWNVCWVVSYWVVVRLRSLARCRGSPIRVIFVGIFCCSALSISFLRSLRVICGVVASFVLFVVVFGVVVFFVFFLGSGPIFLLGSGFMVTNWSFFVLFFGALFFCFMIIT